MKTPPPNGMSASGMHYSEEEWVRYTREFEKSVSSLPQVVMDTCMQTETHMCTVEGRVDALHATMQHSISMCSEMVSVFNESGMSARRCEQTSKTLPPGLHCHLAR